ncbi:MAG: hypothetical protein LBQ49_02680 [Rickettsiales bacterium]|jgi:UDP-N-acetylglucosamine 1-carboxyvinyltransferase|nr:hypothetical protein [Rickettsiales bacterium]
MENIIIPDHIEINGGRPLCDGAVVGISGAKNEVLGAMCAAVLTDQAVQFRNVPFITDVLDMCEIMRKIGVAVDYSPMQKTLSIRAKKITTNVLPAEALKFRASYYIWGALLARFVKTGEWRSLKIQAPGGCGFGDGSGARRFDFHESVVKFAFGADMVESVDQVEFVLPKKIGAQNTPIIYTPLMSHGATLHWMLASALSPDLSILYNASMESEVPHLLGILGKMGARIRGSSVTAIMNLGFSGKLLSGGVFDIMPDRMETGFYALLAMALKSKIKLVGTDAASCRPWLNSVIEIAGKERCRIFDDFMVFDFRDMPPFDGRDFVISPVPGKETDLQQTWTPVLSMARTPSRIYDPVWSGRTGHLAEMAKFGVKSEYRQIEAVNARAGDPSVVQSSEIIIHPSKLHAAEAAGMDLRGTAGLIMCAAMAKGVSRVNDPKFALRGYPNLIENLRAIGVEIN